MSIDKPKLILLVEDEPITTIAQQKALENYGYRVITADSGEKALNKINIHEDIDLILMDIDLGEGIDGTETATKILEQIDLPILFLSSHTEPEIVNKTETITTYGYVVKNSGITVLDASIKMAFKLFDANFLLKRNKDKLIENEEKYRNLHEQSGLAVGYYSPDGIVLSFNQLALKNINARNEDVVGKSLYDIFPKIDADVYFNRIQNAISSGKNNEYVDYIKLSGGENWFLSTFSRICNSKKEPEGVQIISKEITELIQTETELKRIKHELEVHQIELESQNMELLLARDSAEIAAEKYQTFYEFSPVSYFTFDSEGNILELNLHAAETLGKDREFLINRNFKLFISNSSKSEFSNFLQIFFDDQIVSSCDIAILKESHSYSDTKLRLKSIIHADPEHCLVIAFDLADSMN